MALASLKGATVEITGPNDASVAVVIGTGNVTWSERQTVEYTANAGKIRDLDGGIASLGDPEPVDVSLEGVFEYGWSDTDTLGPIHNTMVEADDADCPPEAGIIVVTFPGGACGPGFTTLTFNNFRWESIQFDVGAGSVSLSGKCVPDDTNEAVVFS